MIQCFAPKADTARFKEMRLRLVSASKMDFSYKWIHPRVLHKHKQLLEILFVRSGTGFYIVGNERYPVSKGDIIINNADTLHDEDPDNSSNLNMYCISTTDVQIEELPSNCLLLPDECPVFSAEEYADTVESMMSMIYVMLATDPDNSIETCHYLAAALLSYLRMLSKRNGGETKKSDRSTHSIIAARVKNYIDSHYDEHFTLEDLSRDLCISPYYLSKRKKKSTGFSPMHYAIRRRLGEAQSLLIMTDRSITDIALTIGFGSQSQFYNIFKKYIGMSPGKYRETYGNFQSYGDPPGKPF